mgnify:CR=1 FL=1
MNTPSSSDDLAKQFKEWKKPISIDEYLKIGQEAGLAKALRLLVATNQIGSNERTTRRFLIDISDNVPKNLVDRWLKPKDVPKLIERLKQDFEVLEGESDAMFATAWTYLWPKNGLPFVLWTGNGIVLKREDDQLLLIPHGKDEERTIDKETRVTTSEIKSVNAWASECWCFREVRLILNDENHLVVAKELDCMPSIDFTYGWDQLVCDSSWAVDLGSALAKDLGVPYIDQI